MGYIVNLMVILDTIFSTTSGDILPEDALLVVERHDNSGHKEGTHRGIREFVTALANRVSVLQNDSILEGTMDLIRILCPPPAGTS
jgi:hypothetical protein